MSLGMINDIAELRIGIKNKRANAFFALIIAFIVIKIKIFAKV